jgi:uroporphyrinogen III methyltransferase / synthase
VSERRGLVRLVGAGPGAPDLITLRGDRAIREADVVVYDALVPRELLALAPPGAELLNVGRRGHEDPPRSQEDIHALLIGRARQGKRVVRLKGGDPFVFGRGAEEATACLAAGVDVEVVPGVTSAIGALAAAGIPVTDRRFAASFAVVTGHKDPGRVREEIDWARLARSADTLIVLMGMRNLEELVARILAAGRHPQTPAAVVMSGTTPEQRVVEAPLEEIATRTREAGLAAPGALVIGEVVRLRAALADIGGLPLLGQRIAVTRPAEQAEPWVRALRGAGAAVEVAPLLRIEPIAASAELEAAFARLRSYDLLLLTSANAMRLLATRAAARGADLRALRARVYCVGPATAAAARSAGLAVEALPERHDAEGLLALLAREAPLRGRRVLLPRAARGRDVLPEGLASAGALVDVVSLYRTLPDTAAAAALGARVARGELDALTFASPSAARAFAAGLSEPARAAARRTIVAALGPVTAKALRAAGLAPDVMPERAEAGALIEALAEAVRARRRAEAREARAGPGGGPGARGGSG